jgi:hypothetical protein
MKNRRRAWRCHKAQVWLKKRTFAHNPFWPLTRWSIALHVIILELVEYELKSLLHMASKKGCIVADVFEPLKSWEESWGNGEVYIVGLVPIYLWIHITTDSWHITSRLRLWFADILEIYPNILQGKCFMEPTENSVWSVHFGRKVAKRTQCQLWASRQRRGTPIPQ